MRSFFTSRAAAESYVGVGGGGGQGQGQGDVLLFCVWMRRKAYKKCIKACKSVYENVGKDIKAYESIWKHIKAYKSM